MKPTIKLNPAKSSNVAATGYDEATKTLSVQFKGGATYHYHDVPPETHSALNKAESIGKFIGSNIRNKFKHTPQ